MDDGALRRAAVHAALGDPRRLAIADALMLSDRAPSELATVLGIGTNLLAHHLDVLERAGLIERIGSAGDHRRRYVRLVTTWLDTPLLEADPIEARRLLFVCTANSARSQIAAGLWHEVTGQLAESAGTRPARRVDPTAVAVAARHGVDISLSRPRDLAEVDASPDLIVTVCDRAHEEIGASFGGTRTLHWSVEDPAKNGGRAAYELAFRAVEERVHRLAAQAVA